MLCRHTASLAQCSYNLPMVEEASGNGANIFTVAGPLMFLYLMPVGEAIKSPTPPFFPPHVSVLMHKCTFCARELFFLTDPLLWLMLARALKGTHSVSGKIRLKGSLFHLNGKTFTGSLIR